MNQYPGVTIAQGQTANSQISAYPDSQCVVVVNESPFFLQVTLVGSGVYSLPAYTADCFQVFSGFTGNIIFMPTQYIVLGSGTAPASIAFVQAYGANEPLTRLIKANQATGYPISLNRLQNIGNALTVGNQATSVQNDGNVANTVFVESTVSGDASSAVKITNDAQVTFGNGTHNATITTTGTESVSGSINTNQAYWIGGIEILTKGSDTEIGAPVAGNLIRLSFPIGTTRYTFDQNGNIVSNNSLHLQNQSWQLLGDNGGNTFLGNATVNTLTNANNNFQVQINSVDCFDVNGNGPYIPSGKKYQFIVGTLSRQNGSVIACGGGTTISHGLGVTPAFVLGTPNIAQPGSANVGVGNIGSSTFQATVGAGTQIDWWAASG